MKQIADRLEAHQAAMYAVCLRILRHPQDAEDACQEALLEAARQADSVRGDFGAWARRVAMTTALDVRRRRERRRAHEAQVRPPEPSAPPAVEIDRALSALDEPSRRAVAGHYLDGRPLRELAREAGVSEVAIWKRLAKAKGKLRLLFTAALPAGLIGAAVLLVLLRVPAVAPEQPATEQEAREPWPWELPPRTWPEPVRSSWKALQTRVTIDRQNVPAAELLKEISDKIGRTITVAAGAIEPDEMVSFKVADIVADGALRLMLVPRGMGYRIRDDGTIFVATAQEIEQAGADRNKSDDVQRAWKLQEAARRTWPRLPLSEAEAALARRVREPEGELSLEVYLERLRDASKASLSLDAAARDEDLAEMRVTGRGEEASLETHLRRLPPTLAAVPTIEGVILLTRAEQAAERRTSDEFRTQKRLEQAMEGPFDGQGVTTVPQLVRRLEKFLGAPVLATKAAWDLPQRLAPPVGATPRQVLDGLQPQGLRWAVRDATLFLVK
ncbi:MAG TPA: sigma-70 family RNA polymerase sigma factor [Planctomycetota bacterium]|nr:sigma-70 family RNA polymerase sigma factor [Planctomycetota bacterium]